MGHGYGQSGRGQGPRQQFLVRRIHKRKEQAHGDRIRPAFGDRARDSRDLSPGGSQQNVPLGDPASPASRDAGPAERAAPAFQTADCKAAGAPAVQFRERLQSPPSSRGRRGHPFAAGAHSCRPWSRRGVQGADKLGSEFPIRSSASAIASEGLRGVDGTFKISNRPSLKKNAIRESAAGIEGDAHGAGNCIAGRWFAVEPWSSMRLRFSPALLCALCVRPLTFF